MSVTEKRCSVLHILAASPTFKGKLNQWVCYGTSQGMKAQEQVLIEVKCNICKCGRENNRGSDIWSVTEYTLSDINNVYNCSQKPQCNTNCNSDLIKPLGFDAVSFVWFKTQLYFMELHLSLNPENTTGHFCKFTSCLHVQTKHFSVLKISLTCSELGHKYSSIFI